jgi:hypothetical protein
LGPSPVVLTRFSTWRFDSETLFVRLSDAMALAIVLALFVSRGLVLSERLLGVRNGPLLVIVAVVWLTSAARQLSEYRRGKHSAVGTYPEGRRAVAALVAGTGSWYVLFFAYKYYPDSFFWMPARLPLWVNIAGVALAIFAVISPGKVRAQDQSNGFNSPLIPQLTVQTEILMIAMLLMTGSLVIALMVGLWLFMLLGLPTNPFSGRPQPQLLCRVAIALLPREFGVRILSPLKS